MMDRGLNISHTLKSVIKSLIQRKKVSKRRQGHKCDAGASEFLLIRCFPGVSLCICGNNLGMECQHLAICLLVGHESVKIFTRSEFLFFVPKQNKNVNKILKHGEESFPLPTI